jgi:MoxR-like ATPase
MNSSVPLPLSTSADAIRGVLKQCSEGLVERESLVELVALAAVAGEHLLVIGPPGTAKSEAVRRVARGLGGRYFEYLLGRFTEPSELFGPIDLRKLKEGTIETRTDGMLPEADIAFLDEVFLGSTAILNTLLALLNERTFRRGSTHLKCPLRVCVGASNQLPEDETLAAFADRFLVRTFLDPIPDSLLEDLLEQGAKRPPSTTPAATLEHLDAIAAAAREVDLTAARTQLAQAVRTLRQAGIQLSDRRVVKVQRLVAAAAGLAGRTVATDADLWPIVFATPTRETQQLAREVLRPLLERSENSAAQAAALEASQGPLARAAKLVETARSILGARPADGGPDVASWKLRLEAVVREIDSGFAPETLPPGLKEAREEISRALALGEPGAVEAA